MLKSPLITMILSVLFMATATFAIRAYQDFAGNREKLETLKVRLQVMKQQKQDVERKQVLLARLNRFMHDAVAMGLDKANWTSYDVNIQEFVTFTEMARILDQCVNTDVYYFKPRSLQVKTKLKTDSMRLTDAILSNDDDPLDFGQGDVYLNLRGSFLVRNR